MSDIINFLIIGAGRGGTSLIAALLDQHPQLQIEFERHAHSLLMGQHLTQTDPTQLLYQRLHTFKAACQQEAQQHPNKKWGNKITTEQLFSLTEHNKYNPDAQIDILDYFFNQVFKNTKIIFILRDGRTCIRSKIQRTGQTLASACERWIYSVQVYQFLNSSHCQIKNICIRYEDLLQSPADTLSKVCQFLAISYDDTLLNGTNNTKMPIEYQQHKIDISKLSLENIPEGCYEIIAPYLQQIGYLTR